MRSISAFVKYDEDYVRLKILKALRQSLDIVPVSECNGSGRPLLVWANYEDIDFELAINDPGNVLICSYAVRKALIRKHYLGFTVHSYTVKNNSSILKRTVPQCWQLELDYAEFLDDALTESFELKGELKENAKLDLQTRRFFILKPSMSDRGQGIRIFTTQDELQQIFDNFESESDDDMSSGVSAADSDQNHGVITSQLRHFIVQEYIKTPLLHDARKFHVRVYAVAFASLKVYVFSEMLALCAAEPYSPDMDPSSINQHLYSHLTNTCFQAGNKGELVMNLADLNLEHHSAIVDSIHETIGEVFKAAATTQEVHFQTFRNAFEIFGVDFIISADSNVHLLELNAYPDFAQTGEKLEGMIEDLFQSVTDDLIVPFFGNIKDRPDNSFATTKGRLSKVLDMELHGF